MYRFIPTQGRALVLMMLAMLPAITVQAANWPQNIDAEKYDAVRDKINTCTTCHGDKGQSTQSMYPILAGQEMYYMYLQLQDFQADRRKNPQMKGLLKDLDRDQLRTLAEYFAAQDWPEDGSEPTPAMEKRGKRAISAGECNQCHLSGFKGNSRIPRLAGQHRQYLQKTMLDFKHQRRTNAQSMASLMETYSEQNIKDLAEYLAHL